MGKGKKVAKVCPVTLGSQDRESDSRAMVLPTLLHCLGEKDLRMLIELEKADVSAQHPDHVDERLTNIGAFERKVDERIAENDVFSMKDLAIDGRDIMALGVGQGKEIGRIKNALLELVIDGEIENDRQALLDKASDVIAISHQYSADEE